MNEDNIVNPESQDKSSDEVDKKPVETDVFQAENNDETPASGVATSETQKDEETKIVANDLKAASKSAQVIGPAPVDGGTNTAIGVGEKPIISDEKLLKVYKVRYALSQAQKRIAVNRDMRLFNILETLVHSHVVFIGFKKKKDMDEVSDILKNGTLVIRNTKIDRGLVDDIDAYLKMNTQYVITHNM